MAVREPRPNSRRCVIKARYVPLTARGLAAVKRHLAYIERDGVERDGSPGRIYGADEKFEAAEFRAPIEREPRQFRVIVSPEEGGLLDLTEFTRQFMKQVEKDTGRRLIWGAVNHHDTDNPHVHIVVRGIDKDGDEVRIDGRYIGREMRWRAQEIVTRELGPRPEVEYSRSRSAEIDRERFTEIDRVLAERAESDGLVSLRSLLAERAPDDQLCIARLQKLEAMELAHVERSGAWRLAQGWKESLEEHGHYHDAIERLRPLLGYEAYRLRIVDEKHPTPPFEGVVAGKGLDDELTGKMFAAIRTGDGNAVYLRLPPNLEETLREGTTVRVEFKVEPWLKPADRIVARFAEENGGIYDPARHQRALENLDRPSREATAPTPAERVAANVRRLERLSRYGLASRRGDGRWDIPGDLLGQLAAREQSHPQHRLRVEAGEPDRGLPQRAAPSKPEPARGPAPRPAQRIEPTRGPEQQSRPDKTAEREALGRALAKQQRLTYVSDPGAFKGYLLDCAPTRSGEKFSSITDYQRGQFTLIPTPPDAQALQGKSVTLSRERGQHVVRRRGPEMSR